jgi:hypothetical protein
VRHEDEAACRMSYYPFASSRAATILATASRLLNLCGAVVNLRPIGNPASRPNPRGIWPDPKGAPNRPDPEGAPAILPHKCSQDCVQHTLGFRPVSDWIGPASTFMSRIRDEPH